MNIKTFRRETYDEIWIGRLKLQFFELKLWRLGFRVLVAGSKLSGALPTMSASWIRGQKDSEERLVA